MMKFIFYLVLASIALTALLRFSIEFEDAQDMAIEQMLRVQMSSTALGLPNPDALRAYVCGSGSPLGNSDRAQACIAIVTPHHFYVVDSGAGSVANIVSDRLPIDRLPGIMITHLHSDHIAEIYELNLASWVRGRPEPLVVSGPSGIRKVVGAINDTYDADRRFRIAHHGESVMTPHLGKIEHRTVKADQVIEDGDLTITVYAASHPPIEPSLGYRFDYRGRSIVISGDSNVTAETKLIAANTDLLIHDALAVPVVTRSAAAAEKAGLNRLAKIMTDVMDYHASTESLIQLGQEIDIGMVAYYHLVPVPANFVVEKVFERNLPENYVIADDGHWFELPANSDEIRVITP